MQFKIILMLLVTNLIGPLFDFFITILESLVAKTTNQIDDNLVQILKDSKESIITYILEYLNQVKLK